MNKIKPIIFNTEMVRAILDGRKTHTRRVIKPQPDTEWLEYIIKRNETNRPYGENGIMVMVDGKEKKCPYGVPGDKLWVKETWNASSLDGTWWEDMVGTCSEKMAFNWNMYYKATSQTCKKWRPSRFMPKAFSRITLEVKDVRVERVQDISDEDILAEGTPIPVSPNGEILFQLATKPFPLSHYVENPKPKTWTETDYLRAYWGHLWDSINLKRGYGYDVNPWVFVVVFEKI